MSEREKFDQSPSLSSDWQLRHDHNKAAGSYVAEETIPNGNS
jgi:hypothetical protein